MKRRRSVLGLLGLSAAAAAGLAITSQTGIGDPGLPDLVSQSTGPPATQAYWDGRLLMRFDGWVANNAGGGELEVRASNPNGSGVMQNAAQYKAGQTLPVRPGFVVVFETADGHNHYHLKNAAEYSLWTENESGLVALAQKTEAGFCLEDSSQFAGSAPKKYSAGGGTGSVDSAFCKNDNPLIMGISPGWRDRYHSGLSYQWVDVSNVQPGRYRLASRTDPLNVLHERDESNNGYVFRDAVVPGYRPRPISAGQVEAGQSVGVTLGADRFVSACSDDPGGDPYCSPGAVRFRIESLPQRGTLRQGTQVLSVGQVLTNPSVTYTAGPDQRGADQFTYTAFDSTSPGSAFPRTRAAAAVGIQVGAPAASVAISGAPPSLTVGLSVQLSAVVSNAPGGVSWSTSSGTVSPTGLYTAPAVPPPGGVAAITATSQADPSASATVEIRIQPKPGLPPDPAPGGKISAGSKLLSPVQVRTPNRRTIVARVANGPKTGRIAITMTLKRRVLGRCVARVPARKVLTCRVRLSRPYPLTKIRVTAKLKAGKATAVRRSFARR